MERGRPDKGRRQKARMHSAQRSAAQWSGCRRSKAPLRPRHMESGAVQAQTKGGKTSLQINAESADPYGLRHAGKDRGAAERGLLPQYRERLLQTADMRAKVRAVKLFASADKQYALTGDPTIYAKKIYPLIDDGA